MSASRQNMRDILARELREALCRIESPSAPDDVLGGAALSEAQAGGPALQAAAAALEEAAWAGESAPKSGEPPRRAYLQRVNTARQGLGQPGGAFPDDIMGARLVRGLAAAHEVLQRGAREAAPAPRRLILARYVRVLRRTPAFAADRGRTLATATSLEAASLRAAQRACKETDTPCTLDWGSPAFVSAYSTRSGTLLRLLDPQSAACRAYGPVLAERLLSGGLRPEDAAELTESELCPPALAAEKAEIARRSGQQVQVRESALFRCPHCSVRRCTYQQVQRRSLDEAPDFLCYCLGCHRNFVGR
ncbi:MAG TPA: hypothetical protein VNI01_02420 [Elusimicrobiota bacterium]|nr:hypothetical protein [Elusimicrobiota bacterium]